MANAYPDAWPPEVEFARNNPEVKCIEWFKRTGRMSPYVPEDAEVVFHRVGGPAIEWYDGTEEWMINGKYHREDGPAIIGADGAGKWFFDDAPVDSYNELQDLTGCSDADILLYKIK